MAVVVLYAHRLLKRFFENEGLAEQALTKHGKHAVYLKNRLGFCRIALETGAHLVPVYSFGENDIYSDSFYHIYSRFDEFRRLKLPTTFNIAGCLSYARTFVSLTLTFYAFLLYLTFVIPYKNAINTVVGPPIHVAKREAPSDEQIAQLHQTYCSALTKLFDENKVKYYARDPNARLEII